MPTPAPPVGWLGFQRRGRLTTAPQHVIPAGASNLNHDPGSPLQQQLGPKHWHGVIYSHVPALWALLAGVAVYSSACLALSMVMMPCLFSLLSYSSPLCMLVQRCQALPQAQWRCGNPNCSRRGKIRSINVDGHQLCLRCGVWAMRHDNGMWGVPSGHAAWWQHAWHGREILCFLRDAGLLWACK